MELSFKLKKKKRNLVICGLRSVQLKLWCQLQTSDPDKSYLINVIRWHATGSSPSKKHQLCYFYIVMLNVLPLILFTYLFIQLSVAVFAKNKSNIVLSVTAPFSSEFLLSTHSTVQQSNQSSSFFYRCLSFFLSSFLLKTFAE